ncbi:hypothetical protein EJ02DRAFT_67434 [Clathrospora elynae]|uniref:Uncharacterized protein n=1 Tax=Clathrospora elynae TaxID=706981 RepID=A0A6A5SX89_9PLEO|nr:hypothetical protein EJ02DRAFT_67434 [Clathrospora elynae]
MSTDATISTSPPVSGTAHSPRSSPPLEYSQDPAYDQPSEQQQPPDDAPDEDDIPYLEPSSEQTLLPPPNFRPFFTLIEDATSGEHHHPYLHYVFADDDPAIVTAASMRGLGLDDTNYLPHDDIGGEERQRRQGSIEGDEQDSPVESPLPPPIPGVREHYLIIDVGADGRTIVDAQSFSSEWQITDTGVRTAPSFDEDSPDQGYMLRIEGVEIPRKSKGKGKGQAGQDKLSEAREQQGDLFGALDGLVHGIEGGLEVARNISGLRSKEGEADTVTDVRAEEVGKNMGDEA